MVYGVLVARVPERKPAPASRVCTYLLFFCNFFHPNAFKSPGSLDKYDGEAQMRKSSAGALQHGAALRLFPFASSFDVLKRIVFSLFSTYSVQWLGRCRPLARPVSHSLWAVSRGFGFFPVSALCADQLPERLVEPLQIVYSIGQFNEMSLCRACRCCSEKSPKCPHVSQNVPICSLRVACSDTSLGRRVDSFLLCVVSLACAVEAGERFLRFPSHSRPRESSAPQVSGPLSGSYRCQASVLASNSSALRRGSPQGSQPLVGAGSRLQNMDLELWPVCPGCEHTRHLVSHELDDDPQARATFINHNIFVFIVAAVVRLSTNIGRCASSSFCHHVITCAFNALGYRVHIHFVPEHQVLNFCQDVGSGHYCRHCCARFQSDRDFADCGPMSPTNCFRHKCRTRCCHFDCCFRPRTSVSLSKPPSFWSPPHQLSEHRCSQIRQMIDLLVVSQKMCLM